MTATRLLAGLVASGALAAPLLASAPAGHAAQAPAAVTVTIRAEGVELSGRVVSRRPGCRSEVRVVVWRQVGGRGGGDDLRLAMDTTEDDGSWDTGNTGVEGRFYARVAASRGCRGDTSPTVRASRDD